MEEICEFIVIIENRIPSFTFELFVLPLLSFEVEPGLKDDCNCLIENYPY